MHAKKHHYWQELNQFIDSALSEVICFPRNCMHLIHPDRQRKIHLHKDVKDPCASRDQSLEDWQPDPPQAQRSTKTCSGCGSDIMTRAHSGRALRYNQASNNSFHDWMANDIDRMEPYGDAPHPSGFEQNLSGFDDQHLQRVEQYWIDHQLTSPSSCPQCKPSHLAKVGQWQESQAKAQEAAEEN